jgi:hypothetical protein
LKISYPSQRPSLTINLAQQLRAVLLEGLLEPGAQAHGQGGLRQEVAFPFWTEPTEAIPHQARNSAIIEGVIGT